VLLDVLLAVLLDVLRDQVERAVPAVLLAGPFGRP
jgi:hypothetical protein